MDEDAKQATPLPAAIIVPARLGSTRFPRKLLFPIRGKPLILWTAERLRAVAPAWPLFFAVAERELAEVLETHGYTVLLTTKTLSSGTERVAEANRQIRAEIVINVQADEPLVTGEQVQLLYKEIEQPGVMMATLATPLHQMEDFHDSNQVKVVWDQRGRALYFSRAPIPQVRVGGATGPAEASRPLGYRHLGMYAYTANFLEQFCHLPPGRYECCECLEQLRALEHGFPVAVGVVKAAGVGIDVPEDIALLERFINADKEDTVGLGRRGLLA